MTGVSIGSTAVTVTSATSAGAAVTSIGSATGAGISGSGTGAGSTTGRGGGVLTKLSTLTEYTPAFSDTPRA